MSAEKSPDWIIDLLYADDAPDIDLEGLPDEADLDGRDALELEGLRDLLGQVRASHVDVAPPLGLSASIMEAAREASAKASAEAARPERRGAPPRASVTPGEGSLWGRARANTFAQIGAVAAILLVGAFMVNGIQGDMAMEPMTEGALAQTDDLQREHEEAPAAAAAAPGEDAVALGDVPDAPEAEAQVKQKLEDYAGDLQAKERAPLDELSVSESFDEALDRSRRDEGVSAKSTKKNTTSTKSAPTRATPEPAKSMIALSEKDLDGLVTGSAEKAPPAEPAPLALNTPKGSARGSGDSSSFGTEYRYTKPTSSAPKKDSAPTKEAATVSEIAERASQQRNMARTTAASDADDLAAKGSVASAEEESKNAGSSQTAQPSIGEIERMARSERHRDTISEADRYLGSGLGTNKDRARALELKAEALVAQGKGDEAQRVYDEIEKKYPDFYKREETKRSKRKVRKKSPAKSMDRYDEVEAF